MFSSFTQKFHKCETDEVEQVCSDKTRGPCGGSLRTDAYEKRPFIKSDFTPCCQAADKNSIVEMMLFCIPTFIFM